MEFDDPARGKHDGAVQKPDVSDAGAYRVATTTTAVLQCCLLHDASVTDTMIMYEVGATYRAAVLYRCAVLFFLVLAFGLRSNWCCDRRCSRIRQGAPSQQMSPFGATGVFSKDFSNGFSNRSFGRHAALTTSSWYHPLWNEAWRAKPRHFTVIPPSRPTLLRFEPNGQ